MKPECYLASPLGFSEAGRHYYQTVYVPTLAEVVQINDPWELTTPEELAAALRDGTEAQLSRVIGRRNIAAMRRSTIMIAHLDGQELDAGTAGEVGYCAGIGLTCFGIRSDFRKSGEPGVTVNLQVESFIVESGGVLTSTLDEMVAEIRHRYHRPSGTGRGEFQRGPVEPSASL